MFKVSLILAILSFNLLAQKEVFFQAENKEFVAEAELLNTTVDNGEDAEDYSDSIIQLEYGVWKTLSVGANIKSVKTINEDANTNDIFIKYNYNQLFFELRHQLAFEEDIEYPVTGFSDDGGVEYGDRTNLRIGYNFNENFALSLNHLFAYSDHKYHNEALNNDFDQDYGSTNILGAHWQKLFEKKYLLGANLYLSSQASTDEKEDFLNSQALGGFFRFIANEKVSFLVGYEYQKYTDLPSGVDEYNNSELKLNIRFQI